eukprot:16447147-Heterocapsa_arctica.AAC.1
MAGGFARGGIRVRGFGPASCIPCPPFFVGVCSPGGVCWHLGGAQPAAERVLDPRGRCCLLGAKRAVDGMEVAAEVGGRAQGAEVGGRGCFLLHAGCVVFEAACGLAGE